MRREVVWITLFLLAVQAIGGEEQEPAAPGPGKGAAAKSEESKLEPKPESESASAREKRKIPEDWPPRHAEDRYQLSRDAMVRMQIERRGVVNSLVLKSMRIVPRHKFVPSHQVRNAYRDSPLPIGYDQTISQPYIVASMTEELALRKGQTVLEIGTGSGYQAAVLAQITPWVYTIEIKEPLAKRAARTFEKLGYSTIRARHGDGYYGWPEAAPFDAILVTAAAPHVPPPLVKQLRKGGRMILPVGRPFGVQDLQLVTKDRKGRVRTRSLYAVRFVPLTGSLGKPEPKTEQEPKAKAKPD